MVWNQRDYENINHITREKAIEAMKQINDEFQSISDEDNSHSIEDYWPPGDDYYWKREKWEDAVNIYAETHVSQDLSNVGEKERKPPFNRKKDKKRDKDIEDVKKKDLSYYYHVRL